MVETVTQWSKWFLVFVEAARVDTANNLALQWDPGGGAATFGTVRLSPTGDEPITYFACSTPATETMRDGITQALSVLSWARIYWTDDVTQDENAEWQGPGGWTFTGGIYAAWQAALQQMGLARVQGVDL